MMRPATWMKRWAAILASSRVGLDRGKLSRRRQKNRMTLLVIHQPDSQGPIDRQGRLNARQWALVRKVHEENISDEAGPTQMGSGIQFRSVVGLRRAMKVASRLTTR